MVGDVNTSLCLSMHLFKGYSRDYECIELQALLFYVHMEEVCRHHITSGLAGPLPQEHGNDRGCHKGLTDTQGQNVCHYSGTIIRETM